MSKKVIHIISILIFCFLMKSEKINAINIIRPTFSLHYDTVINLITKDTIFEESYPKDSIIKKDLYSFKKIGLQQNPLKVIVLGQSPKSCYLKILFF